MSSKRSLPQASPAPVRTSSAQGTTSYRSAYRKSSWWLLHALGIGVAISVGLHAVTVLLEFKLPEIKVNRQQDRGLEIVLVNAKHLRAPKDPQALAQANLDGGGTVSEKARTTSPLPPEETDQQGDSLVETQRRVQQLEAVQRELMTKNKSTANVATNQGKATPDPKPEEVNPLQGLDLRDQARANARQEAIVERRLQEYAERPRKSFVGARTQEYRFAQYVEDWRQKIQRVGTLNYPAGPKGRLYGSLMLTVEIKADGTLGSIEINRSSKNKKLDEAALRIMQLASPFAAFPPSIRKDTDILVITRTWTFINDSLSSE